MRKFTNATISTLLVATFVSQVAFGQPANEFALSAQGNLWLHCIEGTDGLVHSFDIVVVNPVNYEFEESGARPVEYINGFECKLVVNSQRGETQVVNLRFPVPSINVGTPTNIVVGYSEPIPVSDGDMTVLATVDVVFNESSKVIIDGEGIVKASPDPCESAWAWFYLVNTDRPSIVESMAYLDADDTDNPLVPATSARGDQNPDFMLLRTVVAAEKSSWGKIKSLYR